MRRRQPLPRTWLMTDPRGGDPVALVRGLRQRTGIIVRHRALPLRARRALFRAVKRAAGTKHVVLLAAPPVVALAWGADGAHDRSARRSRGLRTAPVHGAREMAAARRAAADLVLVSPVFATASHPGAPPLGRVRAGLVAGGLRRRALALGGLDRARFKQLAALGLYGWAGIDAFATPRI